MSPATAKATGAKWLPRAIGATSVACLYVLFQFKHVPNPSGRAGARERAAAPLAPAELTWLASDRAGCELSRNDSASPWDNLPRLPQPVITNAWPSGKRARPVRRKAAASPALRLPKLVARPLVPAPAPVAPEKEGPVGHIALVVAPSEGTVAAEDPTGKSSESSPEIPIEPSLDEPQALDASDPLSDLIVAAATELPLLGDYHEERGISAASLDESFLIDMTLPEETRLVEVMGTIQKTVFTEIEGPLAEAREGLEAFKGAVAALPEPVLPEIPKAAVAMRPAPSTTTAGATLEKPEQESRKDVPADRNVLVARAEEASPEKAESPSPAALAAPTGTEKDSPSSRASPPPSPRPVPEPRLLTPREIVASALEEEKEGVERNVLSGESGEEKNLISQPADSQSLGPEVASRLPADRATHDDEGPRLVGPKKELVAIPEVPAEEKNRLVGAAESSIPEIASGPTLAAARPVTPPSPAPRPTPVPAPAPRQGTVASSDVVAPAPEPVAPPVRGADRPARKPDDRELGNRVFGVLRVTEDAEIDGMPLLKWLGEGRGHIELNALPAGSRNPLDWIRIGKRNPEDEFSIELSRHRGRYRLYATIYKKDVTAPLVPRIPCAAEITADTSASKAICELNHERIESSLNARRNRASRGLVLTGTVFELRPGSAREEVPLPGARVSIPDFPEWKPVTTSSSGNFRFEGVPSNSELLISVEAEGYYRQVELVVTFTDDAYAAVSLVPRAKAAVVTKQQKGNGLIFGRLFDPETHAPDEGGTVSLSHRKEPPVYFGSLARAIDVARDPFSIWIAKFFGAFVDLTLRATSDLGLFAFDNLAPSFRLVSRPGRLPKLVEVLPDTAHYIEFGRAGLKTLKGTLIDLFHKDEALDARVKVVGLKRFQSVDALGNFEIDNVDLPPGIISLEVDASGYPLTRHDVSWNPIQPDRPRHLPLIEKEIVDAAVLAARSRSRAPYHAERGLLVGWLEPTFFPKGVNCVRSELLDMKGNRMDESFGPYPIHMAKTGSRDCLTPDNPEFLYFNLPEGRYRQRLVTKDGRLLRAHVRYVAGDGRVTLSVN